MRKKVILLDLKKMKDIVDEVISYSQNIPMPLNTEDLINRWYESKKRFIDGMNGELIFESKLPITFDIPDHSRKNMVSDLADRFDSHYGNAPLADFIFEAREDFFSNILSFNYPVNNELTIKKGSKIIKAFKYFETDKEKLVAMQNEASLLVQNAKVTGKLCISVHPLDFLSSSENQYNWRSCHALDGEYRTGNLSYMTDDTTVICYLKGEDKVQLPDFPSTVPWNNKKWRMLMFISPDDELVFAGRQYPFNTDFALNLCKNMLSNFGIDISRYGKWTDGRITNINGEELNTPYLYINGDLFRQKDIIQNGNHTYHFNDLIDSSYYTPHYVWKNGYRNIHYKPLIIGGETICVKCGNRHPISTESMLCADCYELYGEDSDDTCHCAECGSLDWIEDMYYIEDRDQYLCSDCAADLAGQCSNCYCLFSLDKLSYNKNGDLVCEHCRESDIPSDISDKDFI